MVLVEGYSEAAVIAAGAIGTVVDAVEDFVGLTVVGFQRASPTLLPMMTLGFLRCPLLPRHGRIPILRRILSIFLISPKCTVK